MREKPNLSIIITTYNRLNFLKQALNSVLKQNYNNYEIIIIDDCSTDGTYEWVKLIKNENIHYIRHKKNKGVGFSRKEAYLKTKGKYIVFMDDDDYYCDNEFFSKALQIFESNKKLDISFVSGNAYILNNETQELKEQKLKLHGYIDNIEYLKNFQDTYPKPFSTFTTIFSKEYLEKAQLKNMKMVNDSSIYMRALLFGGGYIMKENIGVYRIHQNNITKKLDIDFIIQNLEEKKYILSYLKQNKIKIDYSSWWRKQLYITIYYYIYNNITKFKDIYKLLKWTYRNTDEQRYRVVIMIIKIYINNKK